MGDVLKNENSFCSSNMNLNYFKIIHLMSDMERGLQLRQQAIDSGADSETLEEMNARLHRKLDLAELLEFEYRRLRIQRPLQCAFLLFSEGQLKQCIEQQRNALKYTGIPCTTFDYYLDLPGYVVREKLLSCLINYPQDLLNLLVAIPTEHKFAPLTKEELEFELNFPANLYIGEDNDLLDGDEFRDDDEFRWRWTDNYFRTLSRRSDHHRKVILRRFEDFLVNDISNIEEMHSRWPFYECMWYNITINSVIRSMEGMALQEWKKFPVTGKVLMYITYNHVIYGNPERLQLVGSYIWHAEIRILRRFGVDADLLLEPFWRKVCRCLSDMPNLRNFELHHNFDYEDFGDEDEIGPQVGWIAPAQLQLPELPFLKSLNFHAAKFNNADTFPMLRMLLEKYGGQLNQFGFTISEPFDFQGNNTQFRQFPVDLPPCKNLTILSFMDKSFRLRSSEPSWHRWQSSEMVLRFLSNFREVPLKKIKLRLNDSNSLSTLYRLLSYTSRTFGNSLEHLELEFGPNGWSYGREVPSIALLEGAQFPKLVHFATNLSAKELLYKAVLRFPNLETLEIGTHLWYRKETEAGWSKQFTPDLKGENLQNWKVKIWKDLPRLKWIGNCQPYWYNPEERRMITREEVEGM